MRIHGLLPRSAPASSRLSLLRPSARHVALAKGSPACRPVASASSCSADSASLTLSRFQPQPRNASQPQPQAVFRSPLTAPSPKPAPAVMTAPVSKRSWVPAALTLIPPGTLGAFTQPWPIGPVLQHPDLHPLRRPHWHSSPEVPASDPPVASPKLSPCTPPAPQPCPRRACALPAKARLLREDPPRPRCTPGG